MSTRSGSNYLTLASKSRFWYQIAPGAMRPGFMSILVLQSSSLFSWCLVIFVWLFIAVSWVCLRFVIVVFSDHTHLLFLTRLRAWFGSKLFEPVLSKHLLYKKSGNWRFAGGPILLLLLLLSSYDDKIVCGKKESALKWKCLRLILQTV